MKTLKLIFNENSMGLLMIAMMFLACVYLYTQSRAIQMTGLGLGVIAGVYLICFTIVTVIDMILQLVKYVKSKRS